MSAAAAGGGWCQLLGKTRVANLHVLALLIHPYQVHWQTWNLSFFYTSVFKSLEILHSKVRKFATKMGSQQNSVNHHWVS